MTGDFEKLSDAIRASISDNSFRKAVLSKPVRSGPSEASRIDVRPVTIRNREKFQFACRIGNQEQHRNLDGAAAATELLDAMGSQFRDCRLLTESHEWTARFNRKGHCTVRKQPVEQSASVTTAHNKSRQYLIPEGVPVPFLVETGIMTDDGRVRAKHYRKFRQINRFAEFIQDVSGELPADETIRVVDFGCGKSYLTFATHYLLSRVQSRPVQITGLDRRADVVEKCRAITNSLKLPGLQFEQGDITDYQPSGQIHLAVSLHACDTATDDAMAIAAAWKSDVILAVPCCQHELAKELSRKSMPIMSQHGILHERFSSLATDAIRASLLDSIGYRTQVLEFIDMEHTAKNLLIRAVRRTDQPSESMQKERGEQMRLFSRQLGLKPLRLQRKLEEYGLLSDQDDSSQQA